MTAKWWSVDHFIFEEYKPTASSLGIYRVLFSAYILLDVLPRHLWLTNFPDSFFDPPIGLTLFFTGFPGPRFFLVVNGLAIIATVCLLFGYRTRVSSISLALLLLVSNYWAYSLSKIDHDILLILVPLIMQQAGWGNAYSMDAKRLASDGGMQGETNAWPLSLMALMVGMAMMTAAAPKAASGWLDPGVHATQAHILLNVFVTGRSTWLAKHMLDVNSGVFWKFIDYATVLIEASFLLAVIRRRAFRVVLALACFFHLGIALSMEIVFTPNIMAYAAFVEWSALESRFGGLLRGWNWILSNLSALWVLGFGTAVAFVYLRFGNPFQIPQELDPVGFVICVVSVLVATVFLIGLFRKSLRAPARAVILFDGFCGLCNGWVDFVLRHDNRLVFTFAALQSPAGHEILNRFGLPPDFIDSFVLVEDGRIYYRSSAILRAFMGLGFPYSIVYAFVVIPRVLRDAIYEFVAAHRLSWFGKRNTCRVPTPEEAGRFL
jgi:predicted DCC family thiol-disulfide oxidoreductase YuxK/uncharacterized membrane protein YphA (DoxX/SURF4 family)